MPKPKLGPSKVTQQQQQLGESNKFSGTLPSVSQWLPAPDDAEEAAPSPTAAATAGRSLKTKPPPAASKSAAGNTANKAAAPSKMETAKVSITCSYIK